MIKAEIIADSICNGHRITTQKVTFPRIILAEKNTHRMLSRNSASSRAIPFHKMVKMVMDNPFIPIAWQKDHTGMQGKEYLDPTEIYSLNDFLPIMKMTLNKLVGGESEKETAESVEMYQKLLVRYGGKRLTLPGWWLEARDRVVEVALLMSAFQVTKQLCNRLLEPFMWHTVLVTATEWENFFHLRAPVYEIDLDNLEELAKSE